MTRTFYNEGSREIQDRFDSRRIADRLEQVTLRRAFTEEDKAFISKVPMFFLATADADGHPDCSYKGGLPGFVRIVDDITLAFPSYDGNGQFRSLGNLTLNSSVGMLFIDFEATKRIRVNGVASIDHQDPLREAYPGADLVVRVRAEEIFPNCPRYIHKMQVTELSAYAPRPNYQPPTPAWKQMDAFRDHLPSNPPKR
ncbi:MAG TPA: pyridoxamine 5'-phosphate oxidase family protein [Pseudomonadales bacterium]|nr:pyridoxamine 5'-phosphate oxidase family protein [Pseudomonadales bacterium]